MALCLAVHSARADRLFIDPMFGVSVTSNLTYATKPTQSSNVSLQLDVYQPTGAGLPDQLPAIVLMHGGYFFSGSKTDSSITGTAQEFASRGYVVASINYRMLLHRPPAPGALPMVDMSRVPDWLYPDLLDPLHLTLDDYVQTIAAAVSDQASAVDWLAANAATYNVDPNRIAAGGFSAGAVSSLMLGAGAIDGAAADIKAVLSLAGGLFGLESFLDPSDPGVYILHGDQDDVVPYSEVGFLEDALIANGVPYEKQIRPGVGHTSSGYDEERLFTFMADQLQLVPEPQSWLLLAAGGLGLAAWRRRRHAPARALP
jgi:predicted esterase